ncbi:putative inorganic phosphate cotransporter like protein [Argiope bruennichi]|uniref:Putative inorganic phosphate cotransporter like protein n=1 Tax=Argiope bruennichi TaxID=94029 RepID=A0A8T0FFR6_ARGBR|nr:putative inorganic phosphate cotransporter like protein [Argiope bruennichi]
MFAAAVSGFICDTPELGWPAVFYVIGGIGVFQAILVIALLHETPQEHPKISLDELLYLTDDEKKSASNKNGVWSCVPFILKASGEWSSSAISNWFLMKKYLSVDALRKYCNSFGCIGYSAGLLGVYFSGCNRHITAITAAMALFFTGVGSAGSMIVCLDMAPRFSVFAVFGSANVQPWNFVEEEVDKNMNTVGTDKKKEISTKEEEEKEEISIET